MLQHTRSFMAEKKAKKSKINTPKVSKFKLGKQQQVILGVFFIILGLALSISFISYFFTWEADQSSLSQFTNREEQAENLLNKFGAWVSDIFVYQGFGVAALIFSILICLSGFYLFFSLSKKPLKNHWFWGILIMIWLSIFFGFFASKSALMGGVIGFEMNSFLQDYLGFIGTIFLMSFLFLAYIISKFKLSPDKIISYLKAKKQHLKEEIASAKSETETEIETISESIQLQETKIEDTITLKPEPPKEKEKIVIKAENENDLSLEVEQAEDEEEVEVLSNKLVKDFGEFDPKLELSNYKFPTLELLKEYNANTGITIDQEELEQNKNTIVETLRNYKIEIDQIKATVGPTVTLYEIIPEAGIRISKIKNLEDDIALSLSALGIRIIAPIPGKGTIGIEVPNKNPKMVSMRSVIASPKFQNAEMELPLALGKTISNETFVVDLAKMPHLLMAGATGQGKSVGLNAILTSLLYKKHPAEVKFVLVDPKKVELTLFNKIERHYLAKLPDTDDAIITDNSKVINTLNSLCIEMDQRYDLLKDAMVRNIAEYNAKFKARKLNPNDGHKFLPYIVLVVDEFADLIMTAGKEVETPIARLAQLARAIGIHLIIATQRPSVNVITGIIKANFPARIAFRVTSKIDSRTILDNSGADQLIGRGDMLFTQGNELTRLQCAFVDTPEVEQITNYIGSQRAYASAHILPEYSSEEGGTNLDIGIDERDAMFREAAEVLVIAQQGSASLLQRKLKLGYNRAGRIIDQLEAAGIVGPFEGSKARQVLVPTIDALNHLLDNETE